ncbi:MAG: bifunctional (p)ppGpp synthetase/guanosine-3',5'-bis(diphosphate) 3'-pyrophosphohydrolase [Eubacteriaceae bacterium]|nr:bifunctional (p)ppGpp synthetase/guanosine-3',5'-bis(diphosphate) 3'-pyrophosphohydrolase [Eubacteriaceae bacterium]
MSEAVNTSAERLSLRDRSDRDLTIQDLLDEVRQYNPQADCDLITKAYETARDAHEGQNRYSGDPYIVHPLAVAMILAQMHMDQSTIIAGLLHDVIEDTSLTYDDIKESFGEEVADLVDGVTKITKFQFSSNEEAQIESYRKMFVSMASDVRVIIVKLCDRLHNMRTLDAMRPEKQIQKSHETLDIYAPIAHRLGMFNIKWEFEDLALRYLEPEKYRELEDSIKLKRREREKYIDDVIAVLREKLNEEHIECEIYGRPKHFYSIYKKMQTGKSFSDIYDLIAVRVIVDTVGDCYAVLGWVHTLWKPIPGRIKDYIAMPKPNMYQSLHTTVIGPGGSPFEIQIRTKEMHLVAEYGIAAHWKYKEGKKGSDELAEKLQWLMEIKELEKESEGAEEFVESVKSDLYSEEVFVFTPKGKVFELPAGSTPIDFAYRVHTDVGNHCTGAKVHGKIVPLTYTLETGDIVEIITSPSSKGPSRDWLNIVVSPQARNKIRAFLRKNDREENVIKGKEAIKREAKHLKVEYNAVVNNKYTDFICRRFNVLSWDDLFAAIGYGGIRPGYVIQRIKDRFPQDFIQEEEKNTFVKAPKTDSSKAVHVQGNSDLSVKFAHCCQPVPGDSIIGYITRGRGITVHRSDCVNMKNVDDLDRLIRVDWIDEGGSSDNKFIVSLSIHANDRKGILAEITTAISDMGLDISALQTRPSDNGIAKISVDIVVFSTSQVEALIKKLEKIRDILNIYRV